MEWYLAIRLTLITVIALFPPALIATLLICGLAFAVRQLYRLRKKKEP